MRAFRPDASSINLLIPGDAPHPMRKRDPAGLFEVAVEGRASLFPYQLEIHFPDGESITTYDPYSFMPTLGDLDLHLWGEQKDDRAYDKLGAHVREMSGIRGVSFAVWAPNARGVSVVGDFNRWDGRVHMMRTLGSSGVWELFIPGVGAGTNYKYEIRTRDGNLLLKSDPFAQRMEVPPATASIVSQSSYQFHDAEWLAERARREWIKSPVSIYEVHFGSWRRVPEEGNRPLTYREMAPMLGDYVSRMGFTHVQVMPVMEHPFSGSWGYQVSGYFAPTSRYGSPDDLRYLIDEMHRRGIGVILDWVPAHFPKDEFSLGRFDGTALFEHADPRQGDHPEWGTYIFNYGRSEVRNFLTASALYWLGEFHADGLRVDAVASMIYLDYARREGEWIPNAFGGRENLDAISFLKKLNQDVYRLNPGIMMIAEESTAWTGVSRPVFMGGLGFGFKWDMGWMHDTLEYFTLDPIYRRYHHRDLTFGLLYAWSENFVLPLSHDEVVHGKRAMLAKMPGRSLAAVRQSACAVRLHVGALGQEDDFHGPGSRPVARMGSRFEHRLEPARVSRPSRTAGAGARSQSHLPRRARAVGGRYRSGGLSMAGGRRRQQQHDCVHARRAEHRPPRHLRLQFFAGAAQPVSRWRAGSRFLSRDSQH